MTRSISLTVAIPTYNRGSTLQPLLEAIQAQACDGDELLVCDDGSRDNTAAVVERCRAFRLTRKPANTGMVENWNTCLREASREWICIVHDDDKLAPGGLDVLRRACAWVDKPALITHWYDASGSRGEFRFRYSEPGAWAALNCPTIPSGALIHREIIADIGLFDPQYKYSADLEYFPRICARHPSLIIDSPRVVEYHLHGGNHQFATWREPDFFEQFAAIERAVLAHAGITGEEGERLFASRRAALLGYMFGLACTQRNKELIRRIARQIRQEESLPAGKRLQASIAERTGRRIRLPSLRRLLE